MKRRISREQALQVIFSLDYEKKSLDRIRVDFESFKDVSKEDDFLWELVRLTLDNIQSIDKEIESKLKNWKLHRLGGVDRACLRLGASEILFGETEKAIVINEYIEISRKFGDTDSSSFINGVLDSIQKT